MMYSLRVANNLGDELYLQLNDPWKTGLAIKEIGGIGPSKASIHTVSMATNDGSRYTSSKIEERNITIDFIFVEGDGNSIEDSRLLTYKFFTTKKQVKLWFETENRYASIVGYVESNEPVIFSDDTDSAGCRVSIICPNPYFEDASIYGSNTVKFTDNNPLFEFPFSNESVTIDLIELSELSDVMTQIVDYKGDGDIGFVMEFSIDSPTGDITFRNVTYNESFTILDSAIKTITGENLKNGDKVYISTIRGSKTVALVREEQTYNILSAFDFDNSVWMTIHPGVNEFIIRNSKSKKDIVAKIAYQTLYEGI